jgi:hypothetical protein
MSAFETIRERSKNLLIYGGITAMTGAAMLGVGGSVFAQDESTPTAGTEETTPSSPAAERRAGREAEYAAFLDALAVNLGVADGATVDAAIRTTMKQVIDERLAAGEISADLAGELKVAIDSGDYPVDSAFPVWAASAVRAGAATTTTATTTAAGSIATTRRTWTTTRSSLTPAPRPPSPPPDPPPSTLLSEPARPAPLPGRAPLA